MSTLDTIAYRQGVDAGIRQTIERLTKNAQDPARIGKRVLAWKCHFDRERITNFARSLGVSKASASVAVSQAQSDILDIRISNPDLMQKAT
jgi:hypothetical protein